MGLKINQPGLLSLIQDNGRYGYQNIGITNGGAMDEHAFSWANKLLNNNKNAAQIEITYGGFRGIFTKNCYFSVCGADLQATINGTQIQPWRSFQAKENTVIEFKAPTNKKVGLRTYLAVKGGFLTQQRLNSRSCVIRENLGDQALQKGNIVNYAQSTKPLNITTTVPPNDLPEYANINANANIESLILEFFPLPSTEPDLISVFCNTTYTVSNDIDRMGYRLSTKTSLNHSMVSPLSYGTSTGMIQLPQNGQPIILMRDRQTMGGYPLIGCLTKSSINLLSQCAPNTTLNFKPVPIF